MTHNDRALMEHLQRLRDRSTMSQTEMARRLGVPSSYVSFWMNGERLPEDAVLERFVELLGGDMADAWPLIRDRDAKPVSPNRYVQQQRSAPPARRTTLRRSGPPRRTKLTPKRHPPQHEVDDDYRRRVCELPCAARDLSPDWPCIGPITPDHLGKKHMGLKPSDYTCAPMCLGHHGNREDKSGPFKGWSTERMNEWRRWQIELTQTALGFARPAPHTSVPAVPW